jgi:hypothetical protein
MVDNKKSLLRQQFTTQTTLTVENEPSPMTFPNLKSFGVFLAGI